MVQENQQAEPADWLASVGVFLHLQRRELHFAHVKGGLEPNGYYKEKSNQ